jgi:DNA-binding GntR family transcriptional regulator
LHASLRASRYRDRVRTTIPAAQLVYERVKAQILDGTLAGGSLVSEVEAAASLGVSRTPAHEAFLRLATEGLLELLPRRGAVVVPVHPSDAEDVLELRHALELAAVRRLSGAPDAARTRFADEVAPLLAAQERSAADGDVPGFAVLDAAFHRAIVEAGGNGLARTIYGSLEDRQRRMATGALGGRPERLALLVTEHRALADLVAAGDDAAFDAALAAHLADTHALFFGITLGRR